MSRSSATASWPESGAERPFWQVRKHCAGVLRNMQMVLFFDFSCIGVLYALAVSCYELYASIANQLLEVVQLGR